MVPQRGDDLLLVPRLLHIEMHTDALRLHVVERRVERDVTLGHLLGRVCKSKIRPDVELDEVCAGRNRCS